MANSNKTTQIACRRELCGSLGGHVKIERVSVRSVMQASGSSVQPRRIGRRKKLASAQFYVDRIKILASVIQSVTADRGSDPLHKAVSASVDWADRKKWVPCKNKVPEPFIASQKQFLPPSNSP